MTGLMRKRVEIMEESNGFLVQRWKGSGPYGDGSVLVQSLETALESAKRYFKEGRV